MQAAVLPTWRPVYGESTDHEAIGNGALNDVADRLLHRQSSAPTLDVISATESLNHSVYNPEQARQILNATHVLQITLRRDGAKLIVQGRITDLATQTLLHEISGSYSAEDPRDFIAAITGAISKTLRLHGIAAAEVLSAPASGAYLEGLSYLRRDQNSFDLAIPLFRQAA